MLIQIRCYTCGKVIADKKEDFDSRVSNGEDPGEVLTDLGLKRYCCRRMLVTFVEVLEETMQYQTTRAQLPSRR